MAPERSPPTLLVPRLVRLGDPPAAAPSPEPPPYKDELARLYLWQRALEDRQTALDRRAREIDDRFGQVIADTKELEEQVQRAAAEEARLRAEADRLDRARGELDARHVALADAAAVADAQHARLAVFKARLDRQQFDLHTEATALAEDRTRLDAARADLDDKLREAERVRAELGDLKGTAEAERHTLGERQSLLEAELAELHRQREQLAADQARITAAEQDSEARSAEIAEQAAVLKARAKQVLDLQERLEADRAAVREREAALSDADGSRVSLQEQLRRRAEELSSRAKQYDDQYHHIAADRAEVDRLRTELDNDRIRVSDELLAKDKALEELQSSLTLKAAELDDREAALARQVARLKEVGAAVAAERKKLADDQAQWTADRDGVIQVREHTAAELDALKTEAPELHRLATAALEQLAAARDVLKGQLAELHAFASHSRAELDAARAEIARRETTFEAARDEHRLAVSTFRQQVLEWRATVGDLKTAMTHGTDRLEAKKSSADAAAKKAEDAARELRRQQEILKEERTHVEAKRTEVERHLGDLREWYRHKLRDLAAAKADFADTPTNPALADARPEPGDEKLGELLRSHDLIDADALQALGAEARRQRRTLRQVLLTSGAITLYQLALIEAGNLDGLSLDRFRVVDRLRATPRETVYRVFDPHRAAEPNLGLVVLRVLAETEMQDAVHPDEFRQRFALLAAAADPNLVNVLDVLDVNDRVCAVIEWVAGLPGGDWPAVTPGVWLRLVAGVAQGLAALHRVGLVHGRLTSDAVLLTPVGEIKLQDGGLPDWLVGTARSATPAADLRMLGQLAHGWALRAATDPRRAKKAKPFPDALVNLARRLEADAGSPMADEVTLGPSYTSADDLVADLHRLFPAYPCPPDDWHRLLAAAQHTGHGLPLRKAG
jgi:hypothetical protein